MKTDTCRSTRRVRHTAWAFAAILILLPVLLSSPRTAFASTKSSSSTTNTSASRAKSSGPENITRPWGTTFLSRFIQAYRIRHSPTGLQNVAAVRITTPAIDAVVVAASEGEQVGTRNVIFDVYIKNTETNEWGFAGEFNRNDYLVSPRIGTVYAKTSEENFDSEQLIALFLEDSKFHELTGIDIHNLDPAKDSADIETELPPCPRCASRLDSLFAKLKKLTITQNFDLDQKVIDDFLARAKKIHDQQLDKIRTEELSALKTVKTVNQVDKIRKKANSDRAKEDKTYGNRMIDARAEAQKRANEGVKAKRIAEWSQTEEITGAEESGQVSGTNQQESAKSQQEQYSMLGLPSPCGGTSKSLGHPVGHKGQAMTLMAMFSTAHCGEGTPGKLAEALESANLGGVDFSTLEMRYISDDSGSRGLQYSFSGQMATSGLHQDVKSALNLLTNSAADLRTWLVLSPDKFWVNLNPSEPDRIIDPRMGETDAGKAMLQADLQLKTTSAKIIDPRTRLGAEYWKVLAGSAQQVCYGSRMWIVPGEVQVREDGGSLYILKAKLAVKAVPDHVAAGDSRCHYNAAIDARGERLDDAMVVPRVTKAVNTAPEYAAIRRAFMARIVAQWIRDRHEHGQHTSFDKLIDSGNIGPARLQDGWEPRQVYDTYVHQLKSGLFTYKTTTRQGGYIMTQTTTVGGVDFTGLHPTAISAAQMDQQYPQLAQTAAASTRNLTGGPDGTMWLGDTIIPPVTKHASAGSSSGSSFITGRSGVLILIVAVLGVATFIVRRSSRRRRRM